MFENMSESEARNMLLALTEEFHQRYHAGKNWAVGDRIHYAGRVYDAKEMVNLVDSSLDFWLTAGRYAEQFESEFAKRIGVSHCALVNSGSSANLLAFMALTSPMLGARAIQPGDGVITIAASFPTTVAPIVQYGAIPIFLDITIPQYNVDVTRLEDAMRSDVKAVMLAHTLGNPFDIAAVKAFCQKYDLWLIEDNCDALGSTYILDEKNQWTGSFGTIGTSSFYPPHHITMGEGGAVYTDDPFLHRIILSLRDWGRDCTCVPGQDNRCGRRFNGQYGDLPKGYDHKYVYSHFGYNLKATEMQAAIGMAQLEKLDRFVEARRRNFTRLHKHLESATDHIILPEKCPCSNPSWFGFPITCRKQGKRDAVVKSIENKGIQTRNLFGGNLIRQPCFDAMRKSGRGYRCVGDLENTDRVMRDTFWVGVYPGMSDDMVDTIGTSILETIESSQ